MGIIKLVKFPCKTKKITNNGESTSPRTNGTFSNARSHNPINGTRPHSFAKNVLNITFVNTQIVHDRIANNNTFSSQDHGNIRLVSVPDGLSEAERNIPGILTEALYELLPNKIEELILETNNGLEEEERISCVVYDQSIGSLQGVAERVGVRTVAFLPAAAALLMLGFKMPELIEEGIIDDEGAYCTYLHYGWGGLEPGTPINQQSVQFTPTMPIMNTSDFVWSRVKILKLQQLIFDIMIQNNNAIKSADRIICNSVYALEPGAFALAPQIIPISPLTSINTSGHLWPHDSTCLEWLDNQLPDSVVYIAFGSSLVFNQVQFQELAFALESMNRPFLWVVRQGANEVFLNGFLDRVLGRGRVISWVPQQKVLNHSSVACFVSHCGWNSTVESLSNGVPLLCWPYFADQFINQSYICDIWKVGLRLEQGDGGIIASEEIKNKIDQLLGDSVYKETAMNLKEVIHKSEGGNSYDNVIDFVKWIGE